MFWTKQILGFLCLLVVMVVMVRYSQYRTQTASPVVIEQQSTCCSFQHKVDNKCTAEASSVSSLNSRVALLNENVVCPSFSLQKWWDIYCEKLGRERTNEFNKINCSQSKTKRVNICLQKLENEQKLYFTRK